MILKLMLGIGIATAALPAHAGTRYPVAKKERTVITKHGVPISDPYAWMENTHDPDLQNWIIQQNQFTDRALAGSTHDQLVEEFTAIFAQNLKANQKSRRHRVHEHTDQFWRHKIIPGDIQTNNLKSKDERYEITQEAETGRDLKTVRVKETETGQYLPDLLRVKFASFFWEESGESFIYASDQDGRMGGSLYVIRRHVLGTKQNQDKVLFQAPEYDTWVGLYPVGDRWLMALENRYSVKRGEFNPATGTFTQLWQQEPTVVIDFDVDGNLLLQISYEDSDKGQIVARSLVDGSKQVVVEESEWAIESAVKVADTLYISYIDNAASRLFAYDLAAKKSSEIRLPSVGAISVYEEGGVLKISHQSYIDQFSVWTLNQETNALEVEVAADESPLPLTATRVYYTAHDGRQAPIWLVSQQGLRFDRHTPVFLYGYGGFAVNIMPRFKHDYLPWLRRGGAVAFVTLPGGLEFGKKWMQDGQLFHKKNVFDDFAKAGQTLIDLRMTSRETLAMGGGSNGGLLVGATANLYPHLFAAAVPEVGVMDLVNFQRFTGGKWWLADYGDRDVRAEFLNQLRLSPYHQIKRTRYPATLVIPADEDDRVVPSHGYRYAARLQDLNRGNGPILLHTRLGASHGFTGTQAETVRYQANKWTFLLQQLGVE